jgi:hypothetical protein
VAVDQNLARGHRHRAADHADQRRLAGAVGPKKSEYLALLDLKIDRVERNETGRVSLGDGGGGDHRRHRDSSLRERAPLARS